MNKKIECEVQRYLERYREADIARIFGEIEMTVEELERIDYLVDTLELDAIKAYMLERYNALYSQMIASLEQESEEMDSYRKVRDKYESWKNGAY